MVHGAVAEPEALVPLAVPAGVVAPGAVLLELAVADGAAELDCAEPVVELLMAPVEEVPVAVEGFPEAEGVELVVPVCDGEVAVLAGGEASTPVLQGAGVAVELPGIVVEVPGVAVELGGTVAPDVEVVPALLLVVVPGGTAVPVVPGVAGGGVPAGFCWVVVAPDAAGVVAGVVIPGVTAPVVVLAGGVAGALEVVCAASMPLEISSVAKKKSVRRMVESFGWFLSAMGGDAGRMPAATYQIGNRLQKNFNLRLTQCTSRFSIRSRDSVGGGTNVEDGTGSAGNFSRDGSD